MQPSGFKGEQMAYDVQKIRKSFPILERQLNGKPIIYLDNSATSLKPQPVIEAIVKFYTQYCSNIHRGVHALSQEASELFENARSRIARFINAQDNEIIFVRNATEAINLVAHSLDVKGAIVTTLMEHHSNFISWKKYRETRVVEIHPDGRLNLEDFYQKLAGEVALAAVTHVANGMGIVNPIGEIKEMIRRQGTLFLLDASQSVPHFPCDVKALDCDFMVFSGHKMLGPSGIGVLYGKEELLEEMSPFLMGGDMISAVHRDSYVLADLPWKFEAGTPNIEGVIGLGAAVDFLSEVGMEDIHRYEQRLLAKAMEGLKQLKKIDIHGPSSISNRSSALSFSMRGLESHGLAKMLSNRYNIMLRSGYHCAQPLHEAMSVSQSARASFYLYNTEEEIDELVNALQMMSDFFTKRGE